jgi:phage terminase large subunit-like protein
LPQKRVHSRSDLPYVDFWNRTDCLLDVVRVRVDYPALRQLALLQIEKHQPHRVLIEDKASGTQLIRTWRRPACMR